MTRKRPRQKSTLRKAAPGRERPGLDSRPCGDPTQRPLRPGAGLPTLPDHITLPRPPGPLPEGVAYPLPPRAIPRPIAYREPTPPAVLTLRLQFIVTTNLIPVDPLMLEALLPELNARYAVAAIQFVFDPASDFVTTNDFLLDQDFELIDARGLSRPKTVEPGVDEEKPAVDWTRHAAARQAAAGAHRGKLVVFISRGTDLVWDATVGTWLLVERGNHYSGAMIDYVVTAALYWRRQPGRPSQPGIDVGTLAHEIGHYLHLSHTFQRAPKNEAEAATMMRRAVDEWGWSPGDVLRLFDADLPFVGDTPPDPGEELFKWRFSGNRCGGPGYVDVPVTFAGGTTRTYRLEPSRSNVLGYFGCGGGPTFSPDQIRRMRIALQHGNRQHLLTGRDTYVPAAPVVLESAGVAVCALDCTQSPWLLLQGPTFMTLAPWWQAWRWLGDYLSDLVATRDASGVVHLVGRTVSGRICHRTLSTPAWSVTPGWTPLGRGTFPGRPALISRSPGFLDVFVRADDGSIRGKTFDGHAWGSSWTSLGGTFVGTPAACSWGPGRIDLVARGTDLRLWHTSWSGRTWRRKWQLLGNPPVHDPALVSWGPGRLDLVARDMDTIVLHRAYVNSGWNAWESLGGSSTGTPALVASSPDRLDIVVRGVDGAIWHKEWTRGGWAPSRADWRPLGGRTVDSPGACVVPVAGGGRRLEIAARQGDGSVLRTSLDPNGEQAPGPLAWSTTLPPWT